MKKVIFLNQNGEQPAPFSLGNRFDLLKLNMYLLLFLLSTASFAQAYISGPTSLDPYRKELYTLIAYPSPNPNSIKWKIEVPTDATAEPQQINNEVRVKPNFYNSTSTPKFKLRADWKVTTSGTTTDKTAYLEITKAPYIAIAPYNGPQEVYPNEAFTYTVYDPGNSASFARKYTWSAPGSLFPTGSTTFQQSVTWPAKNPCKVFCTYDVKSLNGGLNWATYNLSVTSVLKLRTPGPISGSTTVPCGSTNPIPYSVPVVAGALKYTWILPAGWQFSGPSTGNSILVIPSATTPGNTSEQLCVRAENATLGIVTNYSCITINKRAPVTPSFINPTLKVCVSDFPASASYDITAVNGATSYSWAGTDFGRIPPTGTHAIAQFWNEGVYTITAKAVNACGSSSATAITVVVTRIPEITSLYFDLSSYSTCHYKAVVQSGSLAQYEWSLNNFSTTLDVTNTNEWDNDFLWHGSSYVVSVRGKNFCGTGGTHSESVTIPILDDICDHTITGRTSKDITSIIKEEKSISLFPNPASNSFELNIPSGNAKVKLLTLQGQVIKQYEITTSQTVLNVEDIAPGLYLVSINLNGEVLNKKIQIVK